MSDAFRDFLAPGIASVAGSQSLAARVGSAALAVGLVFSTVGAAPASEVDVRKIERRGEAALSRVPMKQDADESEALATLIRFYGNVGHRHGIDPAAFVTSVLIDHEMSGIDAEKVVLPASSSKSSGGPPKLGSHDLERWVSLVLRHGADSGAPDAVAAYQAATRLEDGKRRKPVTEKVIKHIAMLRDDHAVDAEILAREALRVSGPMAKAGLDAGDPVELYLASSFGVDRAKAFMAAVRTAPNKPAHEVLGVSASALSSTRAPGEKPGSVEDLKSTLDFIVGYYRESV